MFYKKAEERTTHEQQSVELVNRQVRHKWVQARNGTRNLRERRGAQKKYEDLNHQLASLGTKPSFIRPLLPPICPINRPELLFQAKKERKPPPPFYLFSSCLIPKSTPPRTAPPVVGCLGQLDRFSENPSSTWSSSTEFGRSISARTGRKRQRFRFLGRGTVPSGAARLVGHLPRQRGLETQRSSPYDHAQ